jgi:acetylornithine deacetylase/succinyl-diaminopimelate desuccinylase-like protein
MHAHPNLSHVPSGPHVDADAAVAFTQALVRMRTVNAAGAEQVERPAAELGAKAFAATPLAAEVDGVIVCEPEGYEVCTSARGADHAGLIDRIRRTAEEAAGTAGVTVQITVVDDRPAIEIAEDHPVVSSLVAAHRQVHGQAPTFGAVPGTTDGTVLTRDAGLPTVVYGPGGKWAHQKDEYVEVREIGEYARMYAEAARHFLTDGAGR